MLVLLLSSSFGSKRATTALQRGQLSPPRYTPRVTAHRGVDDVDGERKLIRVAEQSTDEHELSNPKLSVLAGGQRPRAFG